MKQSWFVAALLSAVLFGVPACKTTDNTGDETPPPEMTDGGMESGLDAGMDEAGAEATEAGDMASEQASEGMEAAVEGSEAAAEEAGEAAADVADAAADGSEAAGGEAAASGVEVMVAAGENGVVEVRSGGDVVGTIDGGNVSEQLAGWLKTQAQTEGAQITLMVPVSMSFDEVGMPLMKACFAAGFEPTAVVYKPVTE